jgi:cell division protein FtsL
MAQAAVNQKYGQGAVFGSLAYDFDNPELYREEYTTAQPAARPKPRVQTRVHTRARAVVHTRQSIAPLSLVGMLAAAFLLVTAILAQAQIIGISSRSVELRQELETLEAQQAKLRIAYESAFNMAEIEEYAVHSLGMQKPQADQVFYIDTSSPDKAVVIAGSESVGFVDRVSDTLSGLFAYFR